MEAESVYAVDLYGQLLLIRYVYIDIFKEYNTLIHTHSSCLAQSCVVQN